MMLATQLFLCRRGSCTGVQKEQTEGHFSGRYVAGLHLLKHHIFWQNLLHPETFEDFIPLAEASNGMVCDLLTLLSIENLPLSGRSCRLTACDKTEQNFNATKKPAEKLAL